MTLSLGEVFPLSSGLPFLGLLFSVAFFPLIAPRFWHKHFGKISLFWASIGIFFILYYSKEEGLFLVLHVLLEEYLPFVILIATLYVIACGIYISNFFIGTPLSNTFYLGGGALMSSLLGTTGATMVFLPPFLRANAWREKKDFMIVFYIFLVANIGGSLTPVGDPPLFLGYLKGIPFFWPLHLFGPAFFLIGSLLLVYFFMDLYYFKKEGREEPLSQEGFRIEGLHNILLLGLVITTLLFTGSLRLGTIKVGFLEVGLNNLLRDLLLLSFLLFSHFKTPLAIKRKNEFSWFPIKEVAIIFLGLFITMTPVLQILMAGERGALGMVLKGLSKPWHYFWGVGCFSAFLDNAPSYLVFFSSLLGKFYGGWPEKEAISFLLKERSQYLLALSAGAVFFGACTYIGNAPNFMVRSIAEEKGISMPTFFGYIFKYTIPILLPLFLLISLIFFGGQP